MAPVAYDAYSSGSEYPVHHWNASNQSGQRTSGAQKLKPSVKFDQDISGHKKQQDKPTKAITQVYWLDLKDNTTGKLLQWGFFICKYSAHLVSD